MKPALARLKTFLKAPAPAVAEADCEICARPLPSPHGHLFRPTDQQLRCCCRACGLTLSGSTSPLLGSGSELWLLVDNRVRQVRPQIDNELWARLAVPVQLASFLRRGAHWRVLYPGPAGTTKAVPESAVIEELLRANPEWGDLADEVEAILLYRTAGLAFRVSIDEHYHLAGLIRTRWRGFSGGPVWDAIGDFFATLGRIQESCA